MAIFATDTKTTFIDIDRKEGNIFDLIKEGQEYIRRNIIWKVEITDKRNNILKYHLIQKANDVKLDFREEKIGFTIIFSRKDYCNKLTNTTQTTHTNLNINQIKILKYIKEDNKITRDKLAEKIGITSDGVKYNLDVLKKKQLLRRVGNRNSGYWEIIK